MELQQSAPPDVYSDYAGFLQCVADWIKRQASSRAARTKLACEAVRDANAVWGGVGVYTVCELFFLSGMLHILFWY